MTLKSDLYGLIQPLINETTIWLDQSAPRPALPYVGIRLNAAARVNQDHYSDSDDDGVITIAGDREYTLNVLRYGPDSVETLNTLANKLRRVTVIDDFMAKGIAVVDTAGPVNDVSFSQDGVKYEPRAAVDFRLRIKTSIDDDVGYIDSVINTSTFD